MEYQLGINCQRLTHPNSLVPQRKNRVYLGVVYVIPKGKVRQQRLFFMDFSLSQATFLMYKDQFPFVKLCKKVACSINKGEII